MSQKYNSENLIETKKYFNDLYGETSDSQFLRYKNGLESFNRLFGSSEAYIASAGGRVEVLGNHTDHNGGRVLSCAVSLDTLAFFLPNGKDGITIVSEGYGELTVDFKELKSYPKGTTLAMVAGVIQGFINKGNKVGGFNAYITSNVLSGSGISSSASFEVLISEIENFLFNGDNISATDLAIISQYSENEFFGKPSGLLDQSAIALGGLNKLDFAEKGKIVYKKVTCDFTDYSLIVIHTGSSHDDLTDEYASIPREMKAVADLFGKDRLIDIDENEFYSSDTLNKVSDRAISRSVHFFEENKRVDAACEALKDGDYEKFLTAVKESGISSAVKLQNCFVAGKSDQPIVRALSLTERFLRGGVNRVHGGGFAGTVLCIVKNDNVNAFIDNISRFYDRKNILNTKVRKYGAIVL